MFCIYMYKYLKIFLNKENYLNVSACMGHMKQKVTLSIDQSVYKKYKRYCEENAIALSKRIEIFMKREVDEK